MGEMTGNVPKEENSSAKKPAYVQVYEKLYNLILDGTFPLGSRLPSEPKLAQILGTSRMTLRQALNLLHDDGMIDKVRGAGNFVREQSKREPLGLDKIGNPIHKCAMIPIEKTELVFKIEPANEYERRAFNRQMAVIISAHRYFYCHDRLIAYTFSVVPTETVILMNADLNDHDQVLSMLEKDIYGEAKRSYIEINTNSAGDALWPGKLEKDDRISLIYEKIYGNDYSLIMTSKHYVLSDCFRIAVDAK